MQKLPCIVSNFEASLKIAATSIDIYIYTYIYIYSLYGPSIYGYGMLRLNQSLSKGKNCFCLETFALTTSPPQQPAAALSSSESNNIYLWTGAGVIKWKSLQDMHGVNPSYPVLWNQWNKKNDLESSNQWSYWSGFDAIQRHGFSRPTR